MHVYYILPLLAGLLYTLSALANKRATSEGCGVIRATFVANSISFFSFLPLVLIDHQIQDASHWWAPLICGVIIFIGTLLSFTAIRIGEISIQTPLMGSKILIVAILMTVLYNEVIPAPWWIAVFLSLFAIYLLGKTKTIHSDTPTIIKTILLALGASLCFAICDVIMAEEAARFGQYPFLIITIGIKFLCSFFYIPFFKGSILHMAPTAWRWVISGGLLMSLVELIFYIGIALFGKPTAMNILYSSRGIWSIVIIWTIGHWFKNTEKEAGHSLMRRRLLGAVLLFVAIVLVLGTSD